MFLSQFVLKSLVSLRAVNVLKLVDARRADCKKNVKVYSLTVEMNSRLMTDKQKEDSPELGRFLFVTACISVDKECLQDWKD